jgi:hypothetical protein
MIRREQAEKQNPTRLARGQGIRDGTCAASHSTECGGSTSKEYKAHQNDRSVYGGEERPED